jgi:hypothetical protein
MRVPAVILVSALLLSFSGRSLSAQTILNEEFWAELQPLVVQDEGNPTMDTAVKRTLEEGRYVFSGMVYGFSFSYTPLDRSRNIEEEFELKLHGEIPWGDPNLTVHQTRMEGSKVYVRLRYALRDFQESWHQGMRSNVLRASAGTGDASYYEGHGEKITAIRNAVLNAVREHARTRMDNKPKKISGEVTLDAAPRIIIITGMYRAVCSVKLRIDDVIPYRVY